MSMKITRN